uniref:Uncharacterized protein n=1 Tax=Anopheles dirus TaxID=7168 RepID=A0A182NWU0_9DIPT
MCSLEPACRGGRTFVRTLSIEPFGPDRTTRADRMCVCVPVRRGSNMISVA